MLSTSICIPYCRVHVNNKAQSTEHLRECLDALCEQTQLAHQIILSDDSHPDDRAEVREICRQYGVEYLAFPFVQFAPAFSRKFNRSVERASGDALTLLCSNWRLGRDWIAEMAKWLEELGPGNIVCCDNARHNMLNVQGQPYDWFAGYPTKFEVSNYHLVDEGFLTMLHRADWLPFDEDFDPPEGDMSETRGAWHAVVVWGHHQLAAGRHCWIRRDLRAEHMPRTARPEYLNQTHWSDGVMRSKGVT